MSDLRPGYQQTEYGTFPCDWQSVTVASTASRRPNAIVGGPFGSDLVSSDYTEAGVPVIRGQNMGGKFVSGEFAFVSSNKAKSLSANSAGPNDLIFTQRGTLGQVSLVPESEFDRYVVSQSQMKLSVDRSRFNPEYLYYYFTSPTGRRQITDSAIQTGVPHTNLGILRKYRLPVPTTILEQQAIAEALGDADALIEGLEALISKKRDIKQGAMQELLTGDRRLLGFGGAWVSQLVSQIFDFGRSVPLSRAQLSTEGDVQYVHYGDIHTRLHIHLDFQQTSMPGAPRELCASATPLKVGDWVLADASEDYEGIAKAIEITRLPRDRGAVTGLHTFLLRERAQTFAPGFKGYLSCASSLRSQVLRMATGMKVFGISKAQMKAVELHFPPNLDEQRAITAVLSDMDAEIIALEDKLAKARAVKQGMMQVLLTGEIRLI